MTISAEERNDIIQYRIERAYEALKEAEFVATGQFWNLAANRLYYAAFYICEALLLKHQISAGTHAGVGRMINLHFVRTGIIDKNDSSLLSQLFRMRQTGDYEDLSDWQEEEILPKFPEVKNLIDRIRVLIEQ